MIEQSYHIAEMMAVLNIKTAIDKCPPPIQDQDNAEFKVGDMVVLETMPQ